MRSLFVFATVLSLAACADVPSGETGRSVARIGGDGGVCARPEQGCVCTPGDGPLDCYPDPVPSGHGLTCQVGSRYCRDGAWSGCESLRSFDMAPGAATAALTDGPSSCNPCNPDCLVSRDYPTTPDLPGSSTGVVYDPVGGGITLPSGGIAGGSLPDSDGDGVPDVADACPGPGFRLPCTGSATADGFYHTLPYGGPAAIDPLNIATTVRTADIYFVMDTTGSMGGEIANLRSSLTTGTYLPGCSGGVIGAIRCTIPDAWFGVGEHDDYPRSPYGSPSSGDRVYIHRQDITSSVAAAQAAVNALPQHYGADWPESQSQTLWAISTGGGLGPYLSPRGACPAGRWGYPCFRPGTIPIVVLFTDAPFHNGPNPTYDYSFGGASALPGTTAVSGNETQGSARFTGDAATTWTGWTGNTCAMADNYNIGCNGRYSGDAVFRFTVSSTTTITISLDGSGYDTVLSLRNSAFAEIACNDDAPGLGLLSRIVRTLTPGTYYVVVDGYGSSGWWGPAGSCGGYRLSVGNPASVVLPPNPYPVTWAESVAAMNAVGLKVITVFSGGSWGGARSDMVALANATGSLDSAGNPYVFDIPGNGSGLGTAVVSAIQNLANYARMDVTARAVDNPATTTIDERGFVQSITATSFPPGRCAGIGGGGTTFLQCLPGTAVNFAVAFQNGFVMPTAVPQIFDFTIEVVGDGVYVLDTVPVRIVVPPAVPTYPPSGTYWRDYDASVACTIPPQRPDWGNLSWIASTPPDSNVVFEIRTAATAAAVATATPVTVTIPPDVSPVDVGVLLVAGGQLNNLPFLRVTAVLNSSTDRSVAPVLTGFELTYTCVAAE